MYTAYYQASDYISLAQWGGIFFAVFFTGVVAWMLFDKRSDFEAAARLPLEDDHTTPAPASSQR
jgi:cbb3-type cytochrome oxidase subunit 3